MLERALASTRTQAKATSLPTPTTTAANTAVAAFASLLMTTATVGLPAAASAATMSAAKDSRDVPYIASFISTKIDQSNCNLIVPKGTTDAGSSSIGSSSCDDEFLINPVLRQPQNAPECLKIQQKPMNIVWIF